MGLNVLDWVLIVLLIAYAVSGYWQGFIAGAFSTIGLVLGGLIGVWLVPILLGDRGPSLGVSILAILIVLVCASGGQALLHMLGAYVREKVTWQPVRAVDAVGGAALSVVAVLFVSWMIGAGVGSSRIPGLTPAVRDSVILARVNQAMPQAAVDAVHAFTRVVSRSVFPTYLEPFAPERIVEVAHAPARTVRDPDVVTAAASVYKIRSNNKCGRGIEGSGFSYAPGRVMTNAHVVAGVRRPEVQVGNKFVNATVVYYNSDLDVAVLRVDNLGGKPLQFDNHGSSGDVGAALGFPLDGPYRAEPIRIRSQENLRSADIYGNGRVTRDVYSLRGTIRPGNSGGPLVGTDGRVLGVVFAASVSSDDTGYALTASQVAQAATFGINRTGAVSTGACG